MKGIDRVDQFAVRRFDGTDGHVPLAEDIHVLQGVYERRCLVSEQAARAGGVSATAGGGWRQVIRTEIQGLDPSGEIGTPAPAAVSHGGLPATRRVGSGEHGARAGMGSRGLSHPQEPTSHSDGSRRAPARTEALRSAGNTNG